MSRIIIGVVVVVLAIGASGYFYFSSKEYVVRIPEKQLQEKLEEQLPFSKSHLFIFQVTLNSPRVTLTSGSDRINAGLDFILNIKLGSEEKPLSGSLDASGSIKYEPEEGQFYITDPIIEQLSIQGIPEKTISKAEAVIQKALAGYYTTHPIHELKADNIKQAAAKLLLKNVLVENKELVIVLGI
ncbi:MAG: DUF1439 domain-containing protein [Pseudomonadota bacterium]